jgi:hypothetical protein
VKYYKLKIAHMGIKGIRAVRVKGGRGGRRGCEKTIVMFNV